MGELGTRLARGEAAAFAELYDLCADRLHHYLVSQLGSRDDADEVLQETFLRLVRGREKLAGVESIAGYSFMVARNEALRRLAARSNENHRRAKAAELFLDVTHEDHEVREAAEEVTMALARLRPEQREVVELKCYGGLTLAEIADITGAPPGTVATRYRTAIGILRTWLSRTCHD
jgi:RNA polymerase sigma-70 factor (ECF subfamily)